MKFKTVILDDSSTQAIYIPKGFGHGFLSMTSESILNYNTSTVYEKKATVAYFGHQLDIIGQYLNL